MHLILAILKLLVAILILQQANLVLKLFFLSVHVKKIDLHFLNLARGALLLKLNFRRIKCEYNIVIFFLSLAKQSLLLIEKLLIVSGKRD